MLNNEKIVRELYAAAEGSGKDIAKLVSFFSDEGYMCDIALVGATPSLDLAGDHRKLDFGPDSFTNSLHLSMRPWG